MVGVRKEPSKVNPSACRGVRTSFKAQSGAHRARWAVGCGAKGDELLYALKDSLLHVGLDAAEIIRGNDWR